VGDSARGSWPISVDACNGDLSQLTARRASGRRLHAYTRVYHREKPTLPLAFRLP
jgi:hypothetical protein